MLVRCPVLEMRTRCAFIEGAGAGADKAYLRS
jgi:hypothetical protein